TGFDERLAANALSPEEVWQRLRASTANATTVPTAIHFAQFELRFLRDWAARFEAEAPFPIDAVCVHQIACRLYPDLPRRNLRALAGFLGHGLHLERRSLGHAEATAFIWRKLSEELTQRGVATWPALLDFLSAPTSKTRPTKRRYPLDRARLNEQPDAPGVYRMLRRNGDVLYVGKALSLRKRLKSHFTTGATTEQALEMLTQVSELQVTACATALEAALLENETIKQLQPPYNVQLTDRDRPLRFSTRDFGTATTTPDEHHRVGPLPAERALSALVTQIALRQGAEASVALRATAVAAPQRFAPDEQSFAEGYARFAAQFFSTDAKPGGARRAVFDAARQVLAKLSLAAEEVEESEPSSERLWDADRVARHLERA
ncbi:MAG TPA: GIY-YIG nuclease family protein, partial [Polyangiales bacterium]|nr:GIY-YIG nuclease family protein [Polyangiales bacterium]